MKAEDILLALGEIDETLPPECTQPIKRTDPRKVFGTIAACIAAVIVSVVVVRQTYPFKTTTAEPSEPASGSPNAYAQTEAVSEYAGMQADSELAAADTPTNRANPPTNNATARQESHATANAQTTRSLWCITSSAPPESIRTTGIPPAATSTNDAAPSGEPVSSTTAARDTTHTTSPTTLTTAAATDVTNHTSAQKPTAKPTTTRPKITQPSTTGMITTTTTSTTTTTTTTTKGKATVNIYYSVAERGDSGAVTFTVDEGDPITEERIEQEVINHLRAKYTGDLYVSVVGSVNVSQAEARTYSFTADVFIV